jgi:hypothetical protein
MRRYIVLIVSLGLTSLMNVSAQASCSVAPDKPLLTYTSDAGGVEFKIAPATTGCVATTLNYTYAYYDESGKVWEKWSSWAVGSSTGKSFTFKVPTIFGKSRVAFAATSSNKWGTSLNTRESDSSTGIEFSIVAKTTISALINNKLMKFEISHPDSAICSNYLGSRDSFNCNIPIKYRITSEDPTNSFYGNGKVYTEAGQDVGYFGSSTFLSAPNARWDSTSISVAMPMTGKVYLSFTGAGSHHSYKTISQTLISLTVKTAAQVAAEQAAAAKLAAEQEAALELAEKQSQAAKKLTITCTKGKLVKKVTGENPKCPAGYKNPLANFATFQAYSACQLYKKDALYRGAQLKDGGRTLILDGVKESSYRINSVIDEDYQCAIRVMKIPAFVESRIEATRALDGIQSAQWGKVSAFWNFHPDNGLNISFNSR